MSDQTSTNATTRVTTDHSWRSVGAPADGVATLLEVAGWIGGVLSLVGAALIFAEESSTSYYDDPADPTFAIIMGSLGLLMSLLIIGIARIINYTRATAIASRQTVQLLEVAVNRD